jgi:hypothetical protein
MKIKYELPDDMKTDVLAELKNHLAMNGYNAEWQESKSFVVSEEISVLKRRTYYEPYTLCIR